MIPRMIRPTILAAGLTLALGASAETFVTPDGYSIHYNALPTTALDPAMAETHGILRSKVRGLLNVGVVAGEPGAVGRSTRATIEVSAVAPPETEARRIPMREIDLGKTIHYVGEFPIEEEQILQFSIAVQPEGSPQRYEVQLEEQFFAE
ncbi:MAG: DUF4426 domain-containing protein [Chromatiaceae bacterium]|nr:DUF4426 domain-containing protein [Chromatiaceae bacterium]